MIFTDSPQLIAYLNRAALVLYDHEHEVARVTVSSELVQYLEVSDAAKLQQEWRALMDRAGARGRRVMMVLGDSVVFQRTEPRTTAPQEQALKEDFKSKLPFEASQCGLVTVVTHEQLVLFGANKALYDCLVQAADQAGGKVLAVVPAMAYGVKEPEEHLTPTNLARFYGHKRLREQADFLQSP